MRVHQYAGVPIKMWLNDMEPGALAQARNLSELPFVFKHVAIMPDAHQGYGMPIGGVMATRGVVVPNAVGVDIGCGMCAMATMLDGISVADLKKIMDRVRQCIPVGFKKHETAEDVGMPDFLCKLPIVEREFNNACRSLGTLGGGNHFIEFQVDPNGYIWVMIHSGSRNLGKQVADHYNKVAKTLNAKWHSRVPPEYDLAFLPIDSEEGRLYRAEMDYCVQFALANRENMMGVIYGIMADVLGSFAVTPNINIAHNYASLEHHFGANVMVHRKGATFAKKGQEGIIPGSQGTASYIVRGLGNPQSFQSCSHGAGRQMSRKKARETLNLDEQKILMEGIIHGIRYKDDLDEAPGAYKDIDVVMENQSDLVEVVTRLQPLAVIKG